MKPRLGPQGLVLLRHIADVGPITPREGGRILHPDAKRSATAGAGRGNTDSLGVANRAAGSLLGHMVRAGWALASQGERYCTVYSITSAGREALERFTAEIGADPVVGKDDPVPEGRKRCTRCGRARLLSAFFRAGDSPDGLGKRCRHCGNELQTEHRGAIILARDADAAWQRASKETIVRRCLALIRAAREARRVGTWRGRPGLRAYSQLGEALDLFTGSGKDPEIIAEDVLDPDDDSPPAHADPRDAEWSPEAHTLPERIRRLMAVE